MGKDGKKQKTHSTQKMYFGTIPRSEFYGFVIGYAIGLFLTGFLRLQSQYQELFFALVGLGIGYYIDRKYYREPDDPEEAAGNRNMETEETGTGAAAEAAAWQETVTGTGSAGVMETDAEKGPDSGEEVL